MNFAAFALRIILMSLLIGGGARAASVQEPLAPAVLAGPGSPASPYNQFLGGLQNRNSTERNLKLPAGAYPLSWTEAGGTALADTLFGDVTLEMDNAVAAGHVPGFRTAGLAVKRFRRLTQDEAVTAFVDGNATPVPEPAPYVMLVVGLGLLLFRSRTRPTEKFAA